MTLTVDLRAVLEKAEGDLARATANWTNLRNGWGEKVANLDRARVHCGQLRTVLTGLDGSKSTSDMDVARDHCRELRTVFIKLDRSASIPFRCLEPSCALLRLPRTTCWLPSIDGAIAVPRRLENSPGDAVSVQPSATGTADRQSDSLLSAKEEPRAPAHLRHSLLRQAVDLLSLVLAYLQYFFVDVHLQILSLPLTFYFSLPH